MAEGSPLLAIQRGEKVVMPPALWIQSKNDLIHDYRDPELRLRRLGGAALRRALPQGRRQDRSRILRRAAALHERPSRAAGVDRGDASARSRSRTRISGLDCTMAHLQRAINDLVIANRILAHHGVFDEYGHVSVRHPGDPGRFLLARACAAAFVEPGDILEFALDGTPVNEDNRPLCAERFLHARDLRGAAGGQFGAVRGLGGRAAVQRHADAAVRGARHRRRHGHACSGLGHRREIRRRHRPDGVEHGARRAISRSVSAAIASS